MPARHRLEEAPLFYSFNARDVDNYGKASDRQADVLLPPGKIPVDS